MKRTTSVVTVLAATVATPLLTLALALPVSAGGAVDDQESAWASDGSTRNGQIVFRRYLNAEQTKGALFVMNPDGGKIHQITRPPQGWRDNVPTWSPDGKTIAFERFKTDESTSRIIVINPDTGEKRTVVPCTGERCVYAIDPYFSPGGQSLAYARTVAPPHTQEPPEWMLYSAIFVVGLDGSEPHQVTSTPQRHQGQLAGNLRPDLLAPRRAARLRAHSLPPGGEHCCVRPADRLARGCSSDHPVEEELPGSPDVLPRRRTGALPLSAPG